MKMFSPVSTGIYFCKVLILMTLSGFSSGVFSADTLHVISHKRATIHTDPKTGLLDFPALVKFPSPQISIRRVVLKLTLGSPDSMKTAHWDYCDYVLLRTKGGQNALPQEVELARMLTPYGSMFGKGWQFTWSVDLTDFSPLLRDSAEIVYRHTGYEPDTLGWALTLDFEFHTGPPVVSVLGVKELIRGQFKYGDSLNPISQSLLPAEFTTPGNSAISRLRIQHTGHGMDEPRGCSEFCPRVREIFFNGALADLRTLWKDCGDNPLYPQGGTWIYDRANWCPGDLQAPDIIDLKSKSGNSAVRFEMGPYTATKNIQAVENITAYVVHLSSPENQNDVRVEEIIVPNADARFKRENPAFFHPKIVIRNLGSDILRSVEIQYGIEGDKLSLYQWKGSLKFYGSEEITLPGSFAGKSRKNLFRVTLHRPNGGKDAWQADNTMVSEFEQPVTMPQLFLVSIKTNKHPGDNDFFVVSSGRDTVYRRLSAGLSADERYLDTLRLAEGQYHFYVTDSAGDGLEFWAEPDQGYGFARILDREGKLLHSFGSDCGNGEMLAFQVIPDFQRDTSRNLHAFTLFPRRVKDVTTLEVVLDKPSRLNVIVTVDGKIREEHEYREVLAGSFPFYLGYIPRGRIILEALIDGKSAFKGRLMREN